jgi:hypothetical protein
MKRLLVCAGLLATSLFAVAQQNPPSSPAEQASSSIGGHTISIAYSAPSVKGREGKIFNKGGLIQSTHKQYPIWRAGANGATTLTTDSNLQLGNVSVPAGKYTLFVDISNPDSWILIISKQTGEWGLRYDPTQDLGRTKMQMSKPPQMVELLKWSVNGTAGNHGTLTLAWENYAASVPLDVQ